ncbi:hypothetical protein CCAX7_28370 [Capsulimonas corticalis]|uniref:Uncharacterized protein n=1 Tax=Capsulimonas corticalis TaxID=2219043 RepID=A0A402CTA6_9BACT|nr:hypothetical protein [Capsulimonas corticalis]BDI30786.1 hypothetical protein CCAX7_28370 [Capsulimonas corticalis]
MSETLSTEEIIDLIISGDCTVEEAEALIVELRARVKWFDGSDYMLQLENGVGVLRLAQLERSKYPEHLSKQDLVKILKESTHALVTQGDVDMHDALMMILFKNVAMPADSASKLFDNILDGRSAEEIIEEVLENRHGKSIQL